MIWKLDRHLTAYQISGIFRCLMTMLLAFASACDLSFLHGVPAATLSLCGDGLVQSGEECDEGLGNSDTLRDACRTSCRRAYCGDKVVDSNEECDDGNGADGDGCNLGCVTWDWTRTQDGDWHGWDSGSAVATDQQGNVFVTGSVSVAPEDTDIILSKYDPDGVLTWNIGYSGSANKEDMGYGVATDAQGNVVVAGFETTVNQRRNIWIRKYDGDGNKLWTRVHDGRGLDDEARAISIDGAGNVFVTGFEGVTAIVSCIWIGKYDRDGSELWSKRDCTHGYGLHKGLGIAIDSLGNVIVVGDLAFWDGTGMAWFRKYNQVGIELWTRYDYNPVRDCHNVAAAVTTDQMGDILVTGSVCVSPNMATTSRLSVRRYSPFGTLRWSRSLCDSELGECVGKGIACDATGNVLVIGYKNSRTQGENAWLVKLNDAGGMVWSRTHDGPASGADRGFGVAIDKQGSILVTGEESISAGHDADVWIRKYMP